MDVNEFLAQPLVARVAANGPTGPTIRPVWFLYEDGVFWWLTGSSYSRLGELLTDDARIALVIDSCDLETGEVLAVTVSGQAEVSVLDPEIARRKLTKYLGPDIERWDERFRGAFDDPTTRLVFLRPEHSPRLRDLSFVPSNASASNL